MGYFDDLEVRARQAVEDLSVNVQQYFDGQVRQAFVRLGEPPSGNLTQAEIDAGRRGGDQPIAAPSGAYAGNASQASMISQKNLIPLALLLGFGAFLLLKK